MEHKRLGNSGLKVSRLCLARLYDLWRTQPGHCVDAELCLLRIHIASPGG